jgi:hypothetical protein
MSAGLDTRPTATTLDVEQLTRWAWDGTVRIPNFQRPLRWQRDDVIKLFDSMVRGYPVGSLLLWRRPANAETIQLGALSIEAPKTSDARWVVDGQQRITALANALHPDGQSDERFRVSYDLRKRAFVQTPRVEEPTTIPLPVIFDLRQVLRWFNDHPEAIDYVDIANDVTQTLRQFQIPAYEVSQEDPKVLQDIFDRMNNYGKTLTRAEIFSALFAGEEGARDTAPTLDRIAQNIEDDLDFGLIDNNTILQAVFARRGPDVHRDVRIEFSESGQAGVSGNNDRTRGAIDVPEEDIESAYALAEEAIREAVHFLQDVAGVPHFTMLPYKYLLVVLARIFAHFKNLDERSLQLIRRWFWRAAIVGPEAFRGGSPGAVRALNRAVKPGDLRGSLRSLLNLIPETSARLPDLARFRSNATDTKIVLCAWWSLEPRSLTTGEPFERSDLAAAIDDARAPLDAIAYVVSRYSVPRELRPLSANRTLYPDPDNTEASPLESLFADQPPLSAEEWENALSSHLISLPMVEMVEQGEIQAFMDARQAVLKDQLDLFLRQRCEWEFEDTPALASLVIEDDEDEAEELDDDAS